MIKLETLRQVADETLGGLTAGPALFHRAQMKAAQPERARTQPRMNRALAFALSLALVIGLSALALPGLFKPAVPAVNVLSSGPALPDGIRMAADLPRGSLMLSEAKAPVYQGIWAQGSGANFPLIRLDGRYYRLLTHPADVSALKGGQLGSVEVFTNEPALDMGASTLSNAAGMGESVYAVSGMGKAAVAAPVDGSLRLFQRVSFSGAALVGNEGLRDTLPGGAETLQLSGEGTVSDPEAVAQLMDLLFSRAAYQGSQSRESDKALLVQYGSGVVLQLAVSGDSLSACGTWACPEFFEAFRAAIRQ